MRALSPEHVLIIADEVCATTGARVVDFVGLAAIAGATSARFHGVSAWPQQSHPAEYLKELVTRIAPLSGSNDVLAHAVVRVALG